MHRINSTILILGALLFTMSASAAPQCYTSYGGVKPNKLYLYFPPAADSTYPEFGGNGVPNTSPAHAFNIADLANYTGTADALQSAVYDVVADDYCEFNVEIIKTTTAPPTTFARRNTVAVTTDDATSLGLFGLAQAVDVGDATAVDFAYVWGGTYQGMYGGAGGALNGANSTLERWARSLGGTAAHEGGHNYGLSHADGLVLEPGEDALTHHIMASGDHFSGEDRAGYRRHFSDNEYSILAANVGLSVQTLWNWDFINPNAQTATKVTIDFLSTQASLAVSDPYNGSESPWINPTVSASLGTQLFQGVTYHKYTVTWTAGHAWDGHVPSGPGPATGTAGQVAGGASFHVGTGFSGVDYNLPNPVIITRVTLFDASNAALALHPRSVGFDSGALDAADGVFRVHAFSMAAPLRIQSMRLHLLPRLLDINAMVGSSQNQLRDFRGASFVAYSEPRLVAERKIIAKGRSIAIPVAKLSDKRHVVQQVTEADCNGEDRIKGRDVAHCNTGISVSLFPATAVYLVTESVDPNAKHWDYASKKYIVGPVVSHAFHQFIGTHPDLNKNGIDDYIDILTTRSRDPKHIGVPEEALRVR